MRQKTRLEMEREDATRPRKVATGITRASQLTLARNFQSILRWPLHAVDPCAGNRTESSKGSRCAYYFEIIPLNLDHAFDHSI
jgi:hypothetical protein